MYLFVGLFVCLLLQYADVSARKATVADSVKAQGGVAFEGRAGVQRRGRGRDLEVVLCQIFKIRVTTLFS